MWLEMFKLIPYLTWSGPFLGLVTPLFSSSPLLFERTFSLVRADKSGVVDPESNKL